MFQKYNSIENSYRDKFIEKIKEVLNKNELFVIQEKINWANYSFHISKENWLKVLSAWRNWFLTEDISFYTHEKVFNKYKDKIISLYHYLNSHDIPTDSLIVYWELFWGTYPHKDVEKIKNVSKVQKWIFYTPDIEFLAFDMKINWQYVNLEDVEIYCKKTEIPFDPILFKGTLKECLKYPNNFQSIIANKVYWLPILEDNVCEWVVIKTNQAKFLWNWNRIALKNKNSKWKEKIKRKKEYVEVTLSEKWQKIIDNLFSYITKSRIDNVFSKIWKVTDKDFWKIVWLYCKDVLEEFNKDYNLDIIEDKNELKKIKKLFQSKSSEIVREKFKKEVE